MSQLNWKRPLALAVALIALGTLVFWLEYKHKPAREEKNEQSKKLFQLKDVPIASIRMVDGNRQFEFKCLDVEAKLCKPGDNSKWETTQPTKLKADDANVNSLLSTLNNLRVAETIDLSTEKPEKKTALLKQYGLTPEMQAAPGARRVEVTTAKGAKMVAFLGETHPIGDNFFAAKGEAKPGANLKADTDSILLIPAYIKSSFGYDLTHWRDKKLFTITGLQVDALDLSSPKGKVSASKKDGQWMVRAAAKGKSEDLPGDVESIDNLLSAATYLTAKNFAAERKDSPAARAVLKGSKPVLTLALTTAAKDNPAPVILTLFEKKKAVYATLSNLDPLFEVEPSIKDRLSKDLKDLRLSKLITSMERFSAKRLEFSGAPLGKAPIILQNDDAKWTASGITGELDQTKVTTALDRLSGNRIKDFLEGSKIPAGEQNGLRVTLGDEKNDRKRQFVFWKAGDRLVGRDLLSQRKEAFVVDNALADALPWTRDFLINVPKPAPSAAAPAKSPAKAPAKAKKR